MRKRELEQRYVDASQVAAYLDQELKEAQRELNSANERYRLLSAASQVQKELLDETDAELRIFKLSLTHSTKILASSIPDRGPMDVGEVELTPEGLEERILTLIRTRVFNEESEAG